MPQSGNSICCPASGEIHFADVALKLTLPKLPSSGLTNNQSLAAAHQMPFLVVLHQTTLLRQKNSS
jgi:hypothetical protein